MYAEAGSHVTDWPILKQITHMGAIDFQLIEWLPPQHATPRLNVAVNQCERVTAYWATACTLEGTGLHHSLAVVITLSGA